jgi:uncharacterized protein YndB with AHSA1/START domain
MASVMMTEAKSADFVITRVFDAPRGVLWKAFTEPERMQHWFGPKGSQIVKSNMDLRVGGIYHGAMRNPDGQVMWAKFVYREVAPPERLSWVHSFSDEKGGLARHPLSATWPLELMTTVTFEETPGDKTKLTLRWSPINATEEERKTFGAAHDGMTSGWTGSFDQLDAYLAGAK